MSEDNQGIAELFNRPQAGYFHHGEIRAGHPQGRTELPLPQFRAAFQRTAVLAAHLLPFPDEDHERAQPDNQQFQRAYTGIHHSQRDAGQGNRYPFYGKLRAVRAHRERQRSDPYHPPDG